MSADAIDPERTRLRARTSETRLEEIRRQAELLAQPGSPSVEARVSVGASAETGYYGVPLLKPPPWNWEIPAYFFVGGAAGAAAVIAGTGALLGANRHLVRDARRIAALGGFLAPPLLIADLGRPSRFLGMLRVFKLQSPMSVGSWTLMVFSASAAASDLLGTLRRGPLNNLLAPASQAVSTLTGLLLSTYTGVLIGSTAIPVWSTNSAVLPFHFAASGLGAAVSMLELAGHEGDWSLNALGMISALAKTALAGRIEIRSHPAMRPLKSGASGWMARVGSILSGPIPLVLRLAAGKSRSERSRKARRAAAGLTIAGSLLTRIAWVNAGQASARDFRLPLELPPHSPAGRSGPSPPQRV